MGPRLGQSYFYQLSTQDDRRIEVFCLLCARQQYSLRLLGKESSVVGMTHEACMQVAVHDEQGSERYAAGIDSAVEQHSSMQDFCSHSSLAQALLDVCHTMVLSHLVLSKS